MSVFSTCGWILRLGVTDRRCWCRFIPRSLLLAVFALPTVLTSTWRPGGRARRAGAAAPSPTGWRATCSRSRPRRRPGKEVRVTGIGDRLVAERRAGLGALVRAGGRGALGHRRSGTRWRGRSSASPTSARSCSSPSGLDAPAGEVLLVLAAGSRLSAYIGATVGEIGFLRGFWMDGSRRLAWLEDYAASLVAARRSAGARPRCATASASTTCRSPIRAPTRLVLDDVIADAAGRRGRRHRRRERRRQDDARQAARQDVRADVGRDPRRRHAARAHARRRSGARGSPARSRTSSASSSRARHTVGVGDVPRLDDEPAVVAAVERAGAERRRRPSGGRPRHAARPDVARAASRCRSASGRSSRWRAASCATSRCCWSSTSRRRRSTPRPSTRCSSATPRPREARASTRRPHHHPRLAPLLDRAHGRPDRRARRRARSSKSARTTS